MDNKDNSQNQFPYLPIFMSIGISVGVAIGAATDNIPIGMCIGMGVGTCLGAALDAANRKKADAPTEEEKDNENNDAES